MRMSLSHHRRPYGAHVYLARNARSRYWLIANEKEKKFDEVKLLTPDWLAKAKAPIHIGKVSPIYRSFEAEP